MHPAIIAHKMQDWPQHVLLCRWDKFPDAPTRCHTCYDLQEIDSMGRSVVCPACAAKPRYHPRAVEVICHEGRWWVEDYSQNVLGNTYAIRDSYQEAKAMQRRRQGVIKAALTRRANKARTA